MAAPASAEEGAGSARSASPGGAPGTVQWTEFALESATAGVAGAAHSSGTAGSGRSGPPPAAGTAGVARARSSGTGSGRSGPHSAAGTTGVARASGSSGTASRGRSADVGTMTEGSSGARHPQRQRPRWRRIAEEIPEDILELAFGSPRAIVRFYRVHLVINAASLLGFAVQAVLFIVYYRSNLLLMMPVLCLAIISFGATFSQSWLLWQTYRSCHLLTQAFETFALRISSRLLQVIRGPVVKNTRLHSLFLLAWCLVCVIFEMAAPPCSEFKDVDIWKYGERVIPCEMFEFVCTLLFLMNAISAWASESIPQVVERLPNRFAPEGNIGLPKGLLELLPVHRHGEQESARADATCSICIEDFAGGDLIRQLPCGHGFHKSCVDAWLASNVSCPLRCADSIWEAVRARQHAAGLLPAELREENLVERREPTVSQQPSVHGSRPEAWTRPSTTSGTTPGGADASDLAAASPVSVPPATTVGRQEASD